MKKTLKKAIAFFCAALILSAPVSLTDNSLQVANAYSDTTEGWENDSSFYLAGSRYVRTDQLNCVEMYHQTGRDISVPIGLGIDGYLLRERHANTREGRGFLVYGPYKKYQTGSMVASFHLRQDVGTNVGINNAIVRVEAYDATADKILNYRDIYRADLENSAHGCYWHNIRLAFYNLNSSHKLEFRVYFYANAAVWTDTITVFHKG